MHVLQQSQVTIFSRKDCLRRISLILRSKNAIVAIGLGVDLEPHTLAKHSCSVDPTPRPENGGPEEGLV